MNRRHIEDGLSTAFALFLMIGLEASFVAIIYSPWYLHGQLHGYKLALFILIHVLYGLMWINYIACVFTRPGVVPDDYNAMFKWNDSNELIMPQGMILVKDQPRWCSRCKRAKPPRAHHCSACNVCVLKMDHHCPWMGNCVGLFNHGHFVRFCVYVVLCLVSSVLAVIQWMIDGYRYRWLYVQSLSSDWRLVLVVFASSTAIGVTIFVGVLAGYHMHAIAINKTTIEAMEESRLLQQLRGDLLRRYKFPYCLDNFMSNAVVTLGSNPVLWPWPINYQLPDGLSYQVHPDSLFEGQWPVRFKDLKDLEQQKAAEPSHQEDDNGSIESKSYRGRIRRDSEGYLLPGRLFPEIYVAVGMDPEATRVMSDPHLITEEEGVKHRRATQSLSPIGKKQEKDTL